MELCACGSLQAMIDKHIADGTTFHEIFIWHTVAQLVDAVAYLHSPFKEQGPIVHQDIQPANILFTDQLVLKLANTGLTRTAGDQSALYRTPEVRIQEPYDTRADIWCLGALIYYMAALKPLDERVEANLAEGKSILKKYSSDLHLLISTCLNADPSWRPTAGDISVMPRVRGARLVFSNTLGSAQNLTLLRECIANDNLDALIQYSSLVTEKNLGDLITLAIESHATRVLPVLCEIVPNMGIDSILPTRLARNVDAETVLMTAAMMNDTIKIKDNLDEVGAAYRGRTALMYAAEAGHYEAVKLLLREVGMQSESGETALMMAAYNGHEDCVRMLLVEGGISDSFGRTALMHAAVRASPSCIRMLLTQAGRQAHDGRTALMAAASNGNITAIPLLLEREVGLQTNHLFSSGDSSGPGWTALMRATYWAQVECVDFLRPFEGHLTRPNGKTAADVAEERLLPYIRTIPRKRFWECRYLLDPDVQRGFDENQKLIAAITNNDMEGAQKYCGRIKPESAANILQYAVDIRSYNTLAFICQFLSSQPYIVTVKSRMPCPIKRANSLIEAARDDKPDLVYEHIEELGHAYVYDVIPVTALKFAAGRGYNVCVQLLLSELGIQNHFGGTALMACVQLGYFNTCGQFLIFEARLASSDGVTALMTAVLKERAEAIPALAQYEARMQTTETFMWGQGWTALMIACATGFVQAVNPLKGAEKDLRNAKRETALDIAKTAIANPKNRSISSQLQECVRLLSH